MIAIKLNGQEFEVAAGTTIGNLVSHYKIKPELCVVEHNDRVVPKDSYLQVTVCQGDRVEIVRFMAGG